MAERVRVREIDDEGRRLLRTVRRGTGSVVTWRRAQMVLLSAQGMPVPKIAEVTFTSPDRVREVIHNVNTDGFDSLQPKYRGGRPKTFTLPERREIKKTRVEQLYTIAGGEVTAEPGEPEVVVCVDEFGPLNLQPTPGGSGPNAAAGTRTPTGRPDRDGGLPTPARTGSAICSPPTTCDKTSSTSISSRSRPAPGSWSSAVICAACIRPRCVSRSCATTSPRT